MIELGKNTKHQYTQGDEGICPHCSSNSINIGKIIINDIEQDTRKCNNCNSIFSGNLKGGVSGLLREAQSISGLSANQISWVSTGTTTGTGLNISSGSGYAGSGNMNYGAGSNSTGPLTVTLNNEYTMNQKLDNINYSVQSLQTTVIELMDAIKSLVEQNKKLSEKVHSDPLLHIKKVINEFNLD